MGYVSLLEDIRDSLYRGIGDTELRIDRVRDGKATKHDLEDLAQQVQGLKSLAQSLTQWVEEIETAVTEPELDLVLRLKLSEEENARLKDKCVKLDHNFKVLQQRFDNLNREAKLQSRVGPLPEGQIMGIVEAFDPKNGEGIVRSDDGEYRCALFSREVRNLGPLTKGDRVMFGVARRFHFEAKSVQRLTPSTLSQAKGTQTAKR